MNHKKIKELLQEAVQLMKADKNYERRLVEIIDDAAATAAYFEQQEQEQ